MAPIFQTYLIRSPQPATISGHPETNMTTAISRRAALLALAATAQVALAPSALAQSAASYPDKVVKIVVPYLPGGFNDALARLVATKLQRTLKQSVVVENKSGGGTVIGTQAVAALPADGHTLLVTAFPFAVNEFVYPNLSYDRRKDFEPVILAGRSPLVLAVPANSPFRNLADLVKAAKARPGALNYGTAGVGASNHLATELFAEAAGIKLNHVPYKGGSATMADLVGGQIEMAIDLLPNALPMIQAGKLRALAVTEGTRAAALPDTPTIAEALGVKFDVVTWHGFAVRAGTPKEVVERLNREINAILALPETRAVFEKQGVVPTGGSAATFARFIEDQTALWKPIVEKNHIRAD